MEGPRGLHLTSPSNSQFDSKPEPSTASIDLFLERSPLQPEFSRSVDTPSKFPFSPNTPNRFPFSSKTPKALTTVHPDVSQVEEEEIRNWKPSQVAHWLYIAGYNDAVIEKFLINDITGTILLSLQPDDLKELNILSFGMRHQIMTSIKHLKDTMLKGGAPPTGSCSRGTSSTGTSSPKRRSYTMSVSPNGEVLSKRVHGQQAGNQITPAESVSIVGIEQILPKPHKCSKGENCPTYKKRQRQIAQIEADFPNAIIHNGALITGSPGNPETARNLLQRISNSEPSVVASSDVFGPNQAPKLSEEALNEVQKLDRKEAIEAFLKNQHVEDPYPKPAAPESKTTDLPPAQQSSGKPNMAAKLAMLPGLNIPDATSPNTEDMTTAVTTNRSMTPSRLSQEYGSPTAVQQYGPFTQLGSMHAAENYQRLHAGTPASEMDAPVTAIPNGPVARETSQSVPPDMQYGTLFPPHRDTIARSASARPRAPQVLRRVHEDKALSPIDNPADLMRSPRVQQHGHSFSQSSLSSDPDVAHSGYMKKRKTRMLRHEWQDAHFTLRGTNLTMHKDEQEAHRTSRALGNIDVDDYAVACSSLATSSKLTAAFKRSILRSGDDLGNGRKNSAFAFSLVPSSKENEKKALFGNSSKSHHFAVKSREERIEWMRELMLARALKKGKESGEEVLVNGNLI